jgi:hypothetical protein
MPQRWKRGFEEIHSLAGSEVVVGQLQETESLLYLLLQGLKRV